MIAIRMSTAFDGPRIIEIWRNAVDATHHFLTSVDKASIEKEVKSFLPSAPPILAVDQDDHPLAFMLLSGSHMEALFVDPAHHGKGIGRLLIHHALALHPALTTDVNEQNTQAVSFYKHLGFIPTGRSDTDSQGRPYPLIHLRHPAPTP